jgi:hypothetical protein
MHLAEAHRKSAVSAIAIGIVVLAAASNEYVVARFLSADGQLDPATVSTIRVNQAALAMVGLGLFFRARGIFRALIVGVAALNLVAFRTTVMSGAWITTASEGALPAVRQALAGQRHVGYISNETIEGGYIGTERYNLTQYAVAPIVVELGPTREFVIGDFSETEPHPIPDDLVIVRDFGNGVMLLRQKALR